MIGGGASGTLTSRAALFHGHDAPLEVTEVTLDPPREGEVLVRMAAVGVCGSDLHVIRGEWTRPTPMILGHEGSGVVEQIGLESQKSDDLRA